MKSILKIIVLALTLVLFNCKNETIPFDYKYADKPAALKCNNLNTQLYLEALYSFEDDILNFYGKNKRNSIVKPNLANAYNQFIRNAVYGRVEYESVLSEHSLNVFKALKEDANLWDANNTKSHLNYHSPFIKCVSENIKSKNLKETFNSLLSINDLSPKLFGPPLTSNYKQAINDKYIASYIAFDLYYSNFFDLDSRRINFDKPEAKVDFNKIPTNKDPHAGHNH